MKHTPGPWKVIRVTTTGQFVTERKIISEDNSVLANIGPCNIEANAKLIAKAPEMLELLAECADRVYGKGILHIKRNSESSLDNELSLKEEIEKLLEGLL